MLRRRARLRRRVAIIIGHIRPDSCPCRRRDRRAAAAVGFDVRNLLQLSPHFGFVLYVPLYEYGLYVGDFIGDLLGDLIFGHGLNQRSMDILGNYISRNKNLFLTDTFTSTSKS